MTSQIGLQLAFGPSGVTLDQVTKTKHKGDFMKVKVYIGALLAIAYLSGCDEIEGTMNVSNGLQYKDKKQKVVQVPVGQFRTKLGVDTKKREVRLLLKKAINGKSDAKIIVKVPADVLLPTSYGDLNVRAEQSGQLFDLKGHIQTDVSDSSEMQSTESCTTSIRRTVCRDVEDPQSHNRYRDCKDESVLVSGIKDVRYYTRSTTVSANASLHSPQDQSVIAQFSGAKYDSDKIYTYQGLCMISGYDMGRPAPYPGDDIRPY